MERRITVTFQADNQENEAGLAVLPFVETTPGKHPVFGVGPKTVQVSNGVVVTLTARWSPGNHLMSIVVQRDGKIIGHSGTSWERGDPYLGLRLEGVGFLHFYCAQSAAR